jgi:hypothetical protein
MKEIILEALMGDATRPQRLLIWRTAILTAFVAHMFWAAGYWLPGVEAGFVQKKEFTDLKEQVERIEVNQLGAKIEAAQTSVCRHSLERNTDALRYAVQQRNMHAREFRALTRSEPTIPSCQELGFDVLRGGEIPSLTEDP